MKKTIIMWLVWIIISNQAWSQGCIAIRNLTGFGQFGLPQYDEEPVKWILNSNMRFSQFHKTFDGSNEVPLTPENRPYSKTYIIDFAVTRILNNGWSVAFDVPIMVGSRRTWQEHNTVTKEKHTTHTYGLSDVRITAYKWLFDVSTFHKGNIQLGIGMKLPTGDYAYEDYFYLKDGKVHAPVNPTIQLGDGGLGFTLEANSFLTLTSHFSLYGNMFYLVSPREQNGVSNMTGGQPRVPGHGNIAPEFVTNAGADINSVPDAFSLRGGVNYRLQKLTFWGGLRMEGSPVHDVIGGSQGQRRAGYTVSVEPGLNYKVKKTTLYAFVPISIYRRTRQTVADSQISALSGEYVSSPGGMVDYLLFLGAAINIH